MKLASGLGALRGNHGQAQDGKIWPRVDRPSNCGQPDNRVTGVARAGAQPFDCSRGGFGSLREAECVSYHSRRQNQGRIHGNHANGQDHERNDDFEQSQAATVETTASHNTFQKVTVAKLGREPQRKLNTQDTIG